MGIYVETRIRGPMKELWRLTRAPDEHARWDLRFSKIEYLPRLGENEPQHFLYATRLGFGLAIRGGGETVGKRDLPDGERMSALKFWSHDPKSLIRSGAGYWRYIPTAGGIRFMTSYDYRVRFGVTGRAIDALVFRPLLGWATAWSFDRLRLWIERGIDPAVSRQSSAIHLIARMALGLVWLYQGAIPKVLCRHVDELALIQQGGISATKAPLALQLLGWAEILFGLAMLVLPRRWHFLLTVALMIAATLDVTIRSPEFLSHAFNPISLNVLMIALAAIGWLSSRDLPSACRCLRKPPAKEC
jgi:hypothetical protein